jgi:steroid 5-alpha reductase family enzyme
VTLALLGLNAAITLGCMLALWALSIRLRDPSFIDAWWPMGFVVVAWVSFTVGEGDGTRRAVLAAMATVWGLRLGGYLFWRWRRNGPDRRYASMLRNAQGNPHLFTLQKVFLLQGALLWVVSLPLQLGMSYRSPAGLRAFGVVGLVLWCIGFAFETVGDAQLVRFKGDAANEGKVMDRGLWRFTRHPNYFGDACVWWGIFLVSVVNLPTLVGIVGPAVMTFLLARWSGVGPLERGLKRRKPEYVDYIARTSGFIPMPPRARAERT